MYLDNKAAASIWAISHITNKWTQKEVHISRWLGLTPPKKKQKKHDGEEQCGELWASMYVSCAFLLFPRGYTSTYCYRYPKLSLPNYLPNSVLATELHYIGMTFQNFSVWIVSCSWTSLQTLVADRRSQQLKFFFCFQPPKRLQGSFAAPNYTCLPTMHTTLQSAYIPRVHSISPVLLVKIGVYMYNKEVLYH